MGQDQSAPLVDDDTPTQTLKDRSIESVAEYIKSGRARRIVVMVRSAVACSPAHSTLQTLIVYM